MGGVSSAERQRILDMEERKKRQEEEQRLKAEELQKKKKEEWIACVTPLSYSINAMVRGYLARKDYAKLKAIVAKRENIAKEILQTEKSYVENLKILIEEFYVPLQKAAEHAEDSKLRQWKKLGQEQKRRVQSAMIIPGSEKEKELEKIGKTQIDLASPSIVLDISVPDIPELTVADVRALFSQVEVIYNYNFKVMVRLEERVNEWSWTQKLGDLFLEMMDWLKVYIQFVNNYNMALQKLDYLNGMPAFVEWIDKVQHGPKCMSHTIQDYLIMPIQRIPRYVLLLEDLLRNSPEGHIDYEDLKNALAKMKEVAITINEKKGEVENFAILVNIYNRLEPKIETLCEPHRRFIREGKLKEDGKEFCFLLFNDMILKTKENGKKLKMISQILLLPANLADIVDRSNKIKNTFQIFTNNLSYVITAKSSEEKASWLQAIKECIETQVAKSQSFQTSLKKE